MNLQCKLIISFFLVFALSACSNSGLSVNAQFAGTKDIAEGTTVYFGDKVIGKVSEVAKTEYGSKVEMALDTELAKKVNTRAAVVINRLRQGSPLELHNPPGPIHKALQSGQQVEALDSMFQLVGWGIGSTFAASTDSLAAFRDYLKSDEFQRDKANVGIAIDESVRLSKDGIQEVGKAIDDAVNEMNLSEQEMAALIEDLGEEMAPLVQDLAQGGTELMVELERLTRDLSDTSLENQQSGEAFLQSLDQALELLSQSLDDGFEQGLDEGDAGESLE